MFSKPLPGIFINPLHPLTTNLFGCWLFKEGSGSSVYDISSKNYHGTIEGAEWRGSKYGGGLWFDGSNDYVQLGHHSNIHMQPKCTVVARIYIEGGNDRKTIVSKWQSFFFEVVNNLLTVYLYGLSSPGWHNSNTPVPTNKWVSVGFSYNGSNIRFNQNGIEDSNTPAATGTITKSSNLTYIGGLNPEGQLRNIKGYINNLYIYDKALSKFEHKQLYHEPYLGFYI